MNKISIILLSALTVACGQLNTVSDARSDELQILKIFSLADNQTMEGLKKYMEYVAQDMILMPHDHLAVEGKPAYRKHIEQSWTLGGTAIKHELIEFSSYKDIVIARGRAVGHFRPDGSTDIYDFATKNVFIFRRNDAGELRVWQIIFNMEPKGA